MRTAQSAGASDNIVHKSAAGPSDPALLHCIEPQQTPAKAEQDMAAQDQTNTPAMLRKLPTPCCLQQHRHVHGVLQLGAQVGAGATPTHSRPHPAARIDKTPTKCKPQRDESFTSP